MQTLLDSRFLRDMFVVTLVGLVCHTLTSIGVL